MYDFIWTEELTTFALLNLKHSTWAIINPLDMLRAVDRIEQKEGKISQHEFAQLEKEYGGNKSKNFRLALGHLKLVTKTEQEGSYELTQERDSPGFYSGKELGRLIKDVGIADPQPLNILCHNFILHARESLPFCCYLMVPGIPKDYLKKELLDRYVFNQKLNEFKIHNLLNYLIRFEVIKETETGLIVGHAPSALTFYKITSAYLFLASSQVGSKVNASDLQREVDNLLPNRDEDYKVLGFEKFPVEGWGKHQAWITPETFTRFLQIGLVDPLCVARVLQTICRDEKHPSRTLAETALRQLRNEIMDDVKNFRGRSGTPINLRDVLKEFDLPNSTMCPD